MFAAAPTIKNCNARLHSQRIFFPIADKINSTARSAVRFTSSITGIHFDDLHRNHLARIGDQLPSPGALPDRWRRRARAFRRPAHIADRQNPYRARDEIRPFRSSRCRSLRRSPRACPRSSISRIVKARTPVSRTVPRSRMIDVADADQSYVRRIHFGAEAEHVRQRFRAHADAAGERHPMHIAARTRLRRIHIRMRVDPDQADLRDSIRGRNARRPPRCRPQSNDRRRALAASSRRRAPGRRVLRDVRRTPRSAEGISPHPAPSRRRFPPARRGCSQDR